MTDMNRKSKKRAKPSGGESESIASQQLAVGSALADLRIRIERDFLASRSTAREALRLAVEAGKALRAARELVGWGNWLSWLASNFSVETGLSERTAQRYMLLAEHSQMIIEKCRAEDATRLADLSDDELMAQTSLRRGMQLICTDEIKRAVNTSAVEIDLTEQGGDAVTVALASCLQSFAAWTTHCTVGDVRPLSIAAETLITMTSPKDMPTNLSGRILIDVLEGRNATEWLQFVQAVQLDGKVDEVVLLLAGTLETLPLELLGDCSFAVLLKRPELRSASASKGRRLPRPAIVLHIGSRERRVAFYMHLSPLARMFMPLTTERSSTT